MPAPRGNKFAIGNSGKPKYWDSSDELQDAINEYFNDCDKGKEPIPYTIEGLCEVLECDRVTLLNYEKKPGYEEFFSTIKKAKLKIQRNKLERGLMGKSNPALTIFDLKNNHGYKDKTEQEIKLPDLNNITPISFVKRNKDKR